MSAASSARSDLSVLLPIAHFVSRYTIYFWPIIATTSASKSRDCRHLTRSRGRSRAIAHLVTSLGRSRPRLSLDCPASVSTHTSVHLASSDRSHPLGTLGAQSGPRREQRGSRDEQAGCFASTPPLWRMTALSWFSRCWSTRPLFSVVVGSGIVDRSQERHVRHPLFMRCSGRICVFRAQCGRSSHLGGWGRIYRM